MRFLRVGFFDPNGVEGDRFEASLIETGDEASAPYRLSPGAAEELHKRAGDFTVSMAEDGLDAMILVSVFGSREEAP